MDIRRHSFPVHPSEDILKFHQLVTVMLVIAIMASKDNFLPTDNKDVVGNQSHSHVNSISVDLIMAFMEALIN